MRQLQKQVFNLIKSHHDAIGQDELYTTPLKLHDEWSTLIDWHRKHTLEQLVSAKKICLDEEVEGRYLLEIEQHI